MTKAERRYINVVVVIPKGATMTETMDYIRAELKAGGGCRRPDDPLFEGVEVVSIGGVKP